MTHIWPWDLSCSVKWEAPVYVNLKVNFMTMNYCAYWSTPFFMKSSGNQFEVLIFKQKWVFWDFESF